MADLVREYKKAVSDPEIASLRRTIDVRDKRLAELEAELAWYGEQARLCRLIHSEGDAGRNALAADGGKRAREALTKSNS